jgi:hypothetical protein
MIYGSQEVGTEQNIPFFSNMPINWSLHPEMLKAYQDIFGVYNGASVLRNGSLTSHSTAEVLAFRRISGTEEVFVMVNLKNQEVAYDVVEELTNTTWKDAFEGTSFTLPGDVSLGAYEYLILKK